MSIKIPVFVSAPSLLNPAQQSIYDYVVGALAEEKLQPRSLGRSDFPESDPITEVYYVARACYGGLILGFSQIEAKTGVIRRGTPGEVSLEKPLILPTPWNQIEGGILAALRKPLIVFAEKGVSGGVFDQGAIRGYLQVFDPAAMSVHDWDQIRERIRHWTAIVRTTYRS